MKFKEYNDRSWTFSKLSIGSIVVLFFRNLFTTKCPKCKKGRVKYIGDDWIGHTWISVYAYNKCKSEFI
jgi:hypothetical protein